jgi:AbrB family looped-hinge helix DNA binding protein
LYNQKERKFDSWKRSLFGELMSGKTYYNSRLRVKGQVTVPGEIREILGVEEGDELVFMVDENGRVIVERVQVIPPDQAWFWSERWQRLEREVQQDIENGKIHQFGSTVETLNFLHQAAGGNHAEDPTD